MAGVARDDSPEGEVFRRYYEVLVSAIQDPESLADGLFSRKVIGRGLLQEVLDISNKNKKSRKLLLAVQDQLVVNPDKFTEVVEVLQGDGTLDSVVEKLKRDHLATQKPNLEDLEVELRHVHSWVHLGLCLDLPKPSLDEIHASHSSGSNALGKCKIKMLDMWLERCKNPTWSTFTAALLNARLWSTASKIVAKYGIDFPSKVPPKGRAPLQIENAFPDVQVKTIIAMREHVELKHMELHEINECIELNEKEIQMHEKKLKSIKNRQQSKEKCIGLLMSDLQVQQLESASKEDENQQLELQIRQLKLRESPVPEEVRKQFHQAQESIASCQCKSSQLELQIKSLRQSSSELALQLEHMSSNVDDIAKELKGLQTQKKELVQDIHMQEQELDSCLLGKSTTTPPVTASAEIAYYNIIMCAGRVEVKLRQSEIEEYERKLLEKETEVDNLRKYLKQALKKLQELEHRSQTHKKLKEQPSSSDYQYAYMHMQCKIEMEEYEMEQSVRKLKAEKLQYEMEIAMVEFQMCALETDTQMLKHVYATMKTAQALLEQKPPVPPRAETQPPPTALPPPQRKKPSQYEFECIRPVLQEAQPPPTRLPPPLPPKGIPSLYEHLRPVLQEAQPPPTRPPPPLPPKGIPSLYESQLLDPQCKPKWSKDAADLPVADLPVAMFRPHLVKIRNNIYCGGGITGNVDTQRLVLKYDPTADTWSRLPPCPTYKHGLSELDNALVSVGGVMHNTPGFIPTNSVYKFQDPNWVTSLPPMPTARYSLSTFSDKTHLIACGGVTSWTSVKQYTCTTTVEMLNSETGHWSTLAPLPFALRMMSTAISNERCYLIGGGDQEGPTRTACSAPLPLLIESTYQPSPSSAVWEVLPNCPLYDSTAAELGGCVLALGGRIQGVSSTDVFLYSQNSKSWRRTTAVNLPIASYLATSATLAENSIVVVGGQEKPGSCLNTVLIATFDT